MPYSVAGMDDTLASLKSALPPAAPPLAVGGEEAAQQQSTRAPWWDELSSSESDSEQGLEPWKDDPYWTPDRPGCVRRSAGMAAVWRRSDGGAGLCCLRSLDCCPAPHPQLAAQLGLRCMCWYDRCTPAADQIFRCSATMPAGWCAASLVSAAADAWEQLPQGDAPTCGQPQRCARGTPADSAAARVLASALEPGSFASALSFACTEF